MIRRESEHSQNEIVLRETETTGRSMVRGVIVVADDSRFIVELERAGEASVVSAEVLMTSDAPLRLQPGDAVLCWLEAGDTDAVIVGRVGRSATDSDSEDDARKPVTDSSSAEIPDTLVLEAKHSLTLRVGEGSITIREDGKILIKGKDLVSHAQRMNRIKGGAVSIN